MQQSKRIALNTLSSWGTTAVNVLVLIFITRFLLDRLGTDQFGILRYVLTVEASLLFLDLGLGATLNRFVSRASATHDAAQVNAAVTLSAFLFLGLGLLAGFVLTILRFYLPELVVGASPELYSAGGDLMIFIGAMLTLRFWGYAPRGLLFGHQRHDLVNLIQCVSILLRAGLLVWGVMAFQDRGLQMVGVAFMGGALIETCGLWVMAKRVFPALRLRIGTVTSRLMRQFFGFSAYVLLMTITTILIMNAPTLIAGRLYGPQAVAFISLPLLVINQIQNIAGGFAFTLIPVAGRLGELADHSALRELVVRGTKYCALIAFPIGAIATLFGEPLFEWFEKGFGWTWTLLAILVFPIMLRTTQRVTYSALVGAGSLKWLAIGQIGVVAAIFGLSLGLAKGAGMELHGIALGTAIPILIFALFFQPLYACRQIGLRWRGYLVAVYPRVLLCTLLTCAVAWLLRAFVYPHGLVMIVAEGAACMLVFSGLAWWIALSADDRDGLLGLLRCGRVGKDGAISRNSDDTRDTTAPARDQSAAKSKD